MAIHFDRAGETARRLRKAPTLAEQALWRLLREKALGGLRFRRQVPIGPYIADFCCFSARLVVEVDGGVHYLTEDKDAARDGWLATQGFRVLRLSNETVLSRPDQALASIREAASPPIRPASPARRRNGFAIPSSIPREGGRD